MLIAQWLERLTGDIFLSKNSSKNIIVFIFFMIIIQTNVQNRILS